MMIFMYYTRDCIVYSKYTAKKLIIMAKYKAF